VGAETTSFPVLASSPKLAETYEGKVISNEVKLLMKEYSSEELAAMGPEVTAKAIIHQIENKPYR
jgi:hypothetical protein